ncbi:hypothetical protein PoB_003430900 [Plakobranchus ocellatus]|uniref:Uncharacterized protein n=1 Tax=Plakobranchus ocellatus TaxID=259542 RepID=A0AAV4AJ96_9GAST|nr:hypothetical protein PoB_003430900 [Plakobranchus ocellatus]
MTRLERKVEEQTGRQTNRANSLSTVPAASQQNNINDGDQNDYNYGDAAADYKDNEEEEEEEKKEEDTGDDGDSDGHDDDLYNFDGNGFLSDISNNIMIMMIMISPSTVTHQEKRTLSKPLQNSFPTGRLTKEIGKLTKQISQCFLLSTESRPDCKFARQFRLEK